MKSFQPWSGDKSYAIRADVADSGLVKTRPVIDSSTWNTSLAQQPQAELSRACCKTFCSGLRWKRGPLGPRRMRLPKGAFRPGAPRSDFLKHAVGFLNAENPNAASGNPAITPGKVPIQTPTMFVREAPITDKDKTPSLLISDHLITNPNGRRGRPTLNHRTISSRKAYHLVILSDMAF